MPQVFDFFSDFWCKIRKQLIGHFFIKAKICTWILNGFLLTDNDWQWRPKNSADLLIDKIPTRREFNAALEKTASNVAGVLTKFDDFVSNTANEIIESKWQF